MRYIRALVLAIIIAFSATSVFAVESMPQTKVGKFQGQNMYVLTLIATCASNGSFAQGTTGKIDAKYMQILQSGYFLIKVEVDPQGDTDYTGTDDIFIYDESDADLMEAATTNLSAGTDTRFFDVMQPITSQLYIDVVATANDSYKLVLTFVK